MNIDRSSHILQVENFIQLIWSDPLSITAQDAQILWSSTPSDALRDASILLCTVKCSDESLTTVLRRLLYPPFACSGSSEFVQLVLSALKHTRRFESLEAITGAILPAAFDRLLSNLEEPSSVDLLDTLLMGYQHSPKYFLKYVPSLLEYLEKLKQQDFLSSNARVDIISKASVMVHSLIHVFRGYEHHCKALYHGVRTFPRPEMGIVTSNVKQRSWVLDEDHDGLEFPWIEGLWKVDDHQKTTPHQSVHRTAGEVIIRASSTCLGKEVKGNLRHHSGQKKDFEFNGYLFTSLGQLYNETGLVQTKDWVMEGHWSQRKSNGSNQPTAVENATPVDWKCNACTMMNKGGSKTCTTCGTASPPPVFKGSSSSSGNNPAPFQIAFSEGNHLIRMKWSRGDNCGVWMGRRSIVSTGFHLFDESNSGSMDANAILPAKTQMLCHHGQGEECLVVHKGMSFKPNDEFTLEAWICPFSTSSGLHSVILANGEYSLFIDSSTKTIHFSIGPCSLSSKDPCPFDGELFTHVAVTCSGTQLLLMLNGKMVDSCQTLFYESKPRIPFCIGGKASRLSSSSADLPYHCQPVSFFENLEWHAPSFFSGIICEVRVWASFSSVEQIISNSAIPVFNWRQDMAGERQRDSRTLIGYWPVIGRDRYLCDFSSHENHCMLLADFLDCNHTRRKILTDPKSRQAKISRVQLTEAINPVDGHFTIENNSFVLSGASYLCGTSRESSRCIVFQPFASAGHVFYNRSVAVQDGFRTSFKYDVVDNSPQPTPQLSPAQTEPCDSLTFAMIHTSYWLLNPLFDFEVYTGTAPVFLVEIRRRYLLDSSVFAISVKIVLDGEIHTVASSPAVPTISNEFTIEYVSNRCLLLVFLKDVCVFEVSVDLTIATRLNMSEEELKELKETDASIWGTAPSPTNLWVGFVCKSDVATKAINKSSLLSNWVFETSKRSEIGQSIVPAFHAVYEAVNCRKSSRKKTGDSQEGMEYCSKHGTDGSAIHQDYSYGCKTCNLVHGQELCYTCAKYCHPHHELVAVGPKTIACGCGSQGMGECKCRSGFIPEGTSSYELKCNLWCCDRCTVVNPSSSTVCNVCGSSCTFPLDDPKSLKEDKEITPMEGVSLTIPEQSAGQVESGKMQSLTEWICTACTMINPATLTNCGTCNTERSSTSVVEQVVPSEWSCTACTMINGEKNSSCYICGTVRALPAPVPVDMGKNSSPSSSQCKSIVIHPTANLDTATSQTASTSINTTDSSDALVTEKQELLKEFWKYKEKWLVEQIRNNSLVLKKSPEISSESSVNGFEWDTTIGYLTFQEGKDIVGVEIEGEYTNGDGHLTGISTVNDQGQWYLRGQYIHNNQTAENAFELKFQDGGKKFVGYWYRGDASGEWKCNHSPNYESFRGLEKGRPFYSGLVNMKENLTNVCYQNSFLQALYMTSSFREAVLSVPPESISLLTSSGSASDLGVDGGTPSAMFSTIQKLFAQLSFSQRKHIFTYELQRCLPSIFQQGRQQDTSDFAHFIVDQLNHTFQDLEILKQSSGENKEIIDPLRMSFGGVQATVLSCMECSSISTKTEYFWELMLNMVDLRYTPITDLAVVSGTMLNIPIPKGFLRLNMNLNKGRDHAPYLFLCLERKNLVKETSGPVSLPITDLLVRTVPRGSSKPESHGFTRVDMDLNLGGTGDHVYLFYKKDPTGSPITDLSVIFGNENVPDGFRQIKVDLNQGIGEKVFLCYKCDMPLRDLQVVTEGRPGYKTIDTNLNLVSRRNPHAKSSVAQYLAHTDGGFSPCLTGLRLVPFKDKAIVEAEGWKNTGPPLANGYCLMIQAGEGNPIFAIDVFRSPRTVPRFMDYEVIRIPEELVENVKDGEGKSESIEPSVNSVLGAWNAEEATDRPRRAIELTSIGPSVNMFYVEGNFENRTNGKFHGLLQTVAADKFQFAGLWEDSSTKHGQLMQVHFNKGPTPSASMILSGTVGDGKGDKVIISGNQVSNKVDHKAPICDICLIRDGESVPAGFTKVGLLEAPTLGRDLLAETGSSEELYLCVQRLETSDVSAGGSVEFVTDIIVVYGDIDSIADGYIPLYHTKFGQSANLNSGNIGIPIYLCFRKQPYTVGGTTKPIMEVSLVGNSSGTNKTSSTLPDGYVKIQQTPLGMDANINSGTSAPPLFVCYKRENPATSSIPHPANGTYNTSIWGKMTVYACGEVQGHQVEGRYGPVIHGNLPGAMQGYLVKPCLMNLESNEFFKKSIPSSFKPEFTLLGTWATSAHQSPYPFEMYFNRHLDTSFGFWSCGAEGGKWNLVKDKYVEIGIKKDYGTQWKSGKLLTSDRVSTHNVANMLNRFIAPRVLGGENQLECSTCSKKTTCLTQTVISRPPEHLILTFKRMWYDWKLQKTMKSLHSVSFPPYFKVPEVPEEFQNHVYKTEEEKLEGKNRYYGIYAVLVHNGMSANSGHYYTYARNSSNAMSELHLEDAPNAPWMKFNDMEITMTSWKDMVESIGNSVSDSVYLLFYKKLPESIAEEIVRHEEDIMECAASPTSDENLLATPQKPKRDEDDDEMLLAQAMALSMSSTAGSIEGLEECKTTGSDVKGSSGALTSESLSTDYQFDAEGDKVVKGLLEKVSQSNGEYLMKEVTNRSGSLLLDEFQLFCKFKNSFPDTVSSTFCAALQK